MIKVMTKYICPPIPVRCADWVAWIDGQEESDINGVGETEVLALLALGYIVKTGDQVDAVKKALAEARKREAVE